MPIVNVIDILLKGKDSHFEGRLVDEFLAISVPKIIKVFLSESHGKMKIEDEKLLRQYNLLDIYRIGTSENQTDNEKYVYDLFNRYYTGEITKQEQANE